MTTGQWERTGSELLSPHPDAQINRKKCSCTTILCTETAGPYLLIYYLFLKLPILTPDSTSGSSFRSLVPVLCASVDSFSVSLVSVEEGGRPSPLAHR
ncbi:hypothetical protein M513_09306 [Trichuris suis]|uniref:Uncharacterized protein n=1 Tax=Trichuris suis TaxID=68888 RepID=A0A085LXZ3_9BILA|nr:hypothetical protein M513_09306 [Trichuris suis]